MTLTLTQLKALPLARYEFRLRARADALLPPFLGSTLRGSLGHALKTIACTMRHQDCSRCLLAEACVYTNVFEPSVLNLDSDAQGRKDPPRPFLLQPPLPLGPDATSTIEESQRAWRAQHIPVSNGTSLSFGVTLIGSAAIARLPYLICAVELMARHGLGHALAPFALEEVLVVNERNERASIYSPRNAEPQTTRVTPPRAALTTLYDLVARRLAQITTSGALTLLFITPTWIEINKETLGSVTCEQLFKRLSWRAARLFELYGDTPLVFDHRELIAKAATVETASEDVWMHRFVRYSNRRQGETPMRGFLGAIAYRGKALKELLPLIVAGEFLQLGKETAFGLGRYLCAA